jgi:hypothetical protein
LEKIVEKAIRGDLDCARFLWSYIYGTPIQRNEHTGAEGGPIQVETMKPSDIAATVAALLSAHEQVGG